MSADLDDAIAAKRRVLASIDDEIRLARQKRNAVILATDKIAANIVAAAEAKAAEMLRQAGDTLRANT